MDNHSHMQSEVSPNGKIIRADARKIFTGQSMKKLHYELFMAKNFNSDTFWPKVISPRYVISLHEMVLYYNVSGEA